MTLADPQRNPGASYEAQPDPFLRVAGWGGLGFLATVIVENVMRQPQPLPGASVQEIAAYYLARPGLLGISEGLFALAIPCLLLFAIGTARRLAAATPEAAPWAWTGAIAASLMTATFGVTMALDVALNASASLLVANPALTLVIWRFKVAVFTVNLVALSTGILAFGIGARLAKIIPPWLASLTALAGVVGLVASFPMKWIAEGSLWGAVGFFSFLVWLMFLSATSVSHLRAATRTR